MENCISSFLFRILLSQVLIYVFVTTVFGDVKVLPKEKYPSPFRDPRHCGGNQDKRTFICDYPGILDDKQRKSLNNLIKDIENKTKCICQHCVPDQYGFRVGVAIAEAIPRVSGKEVGPSMVIYGDYLRTNTWKIGKCGDDILVLWSVKDKKIYASRGIKVMKILSGDELSDIYEEQGDKLHSYEGLYNILKSFMNNFQKSQDPTHVNLPYIIGGAIGGFVLLVLIVACIVTSCRRRRRKNSKKVVYRKAQSEDMRKKIAGFENKKGMYSKSDYEKVKLDEPDLRNNP